MPNRVTYEVSQQLHRLGYWESQYYYNLYNRHLFSRPIPTPVESLPAPTWEQLYEWLREERGVEILNPEPELVLELLRSL